MTNRVSTVGAAIVALAAVLLSAGCSATKPSTPVPPVPESVTTAEVHVVADVYRSRVDPARGGIQLSVRNDAATPLTIVLAVLESPALEAPIERVRETVIGPGQTRDLTMILTAAACPAAHTEPPDAVLTIVLADGTTAKLRVPTTDRLGQWADWLTAECFASAIADRATIALQHDPARDSGTLIGLLLNIEPHAPGLDMVAVSDTVLFGLVEIDSGARATSVDLSGATSRSEFSGERGTVSIPLLLTPARCDAHVLADDKQGTLFRLDVLLDGELGSVTIAADATTRGALYDAFTRACGI